jgi:hypothetical protein
MHYNKTTYLAGFYLLLSLLIILQLVIKIQKSETAVRFQVSWRNVSAEITNSSLLLTINFLKQSYL